MIQKHRDGNWLAQPKRQTVRRVSELTEAVKKKKFEMRY